MANKTAQITQEPSLEPASTLGHARRWLVSYPRAIPLAIFLAIAAITALSVFAIESNARERERAQVREATQSISFALKRRANNFSSYLRAGAALFSAGEQLELDIFRRYVDELRLKENYRGSEGIGWVNVLDAQAIPGFIANQRQQQPNYPDIRPVIPENADKAAPVAFFHPDSKRNRRALGFDMYSDPVRETAMAKALSTGLPTASARTVLAQEAGGDTPGFIIVMPVLRPSESRAQNDPINGAMSLAGYVYSPFNADRFLDAAMEGGEFKAFGVDLYDNPATGPELLVSHAPTANGVQSGGAQLEQKLSIANRDFLLVVEGPKGDALDPLSMTTLLFGLTLASLLMLLARLLTQQAFEDQTRLTFFEEQNSIRNTLTRELNHRVKNTLANVLSILALTRRRAKSLDDFADSLEGRIRALSATHDLLTGRDWGPTPLRSVIGAELQHFRSSKDCDIHIAGPDIELAPNDALSFGLAVHELATNAAKYGALSVEHGQVSITWAVIDNCIAAVVWRESGGPEVTPPKNRGFGTELIEKIVAHELKHPVKLDFNKDGVRCEMRVPMRPCRDFHIREGAQD